MDCIVRSADRTLYEGDAEQVAARSPYGEFAVRNGHAALLSILVPGVVRLTVSGSEQAFACKGGTFSFKDNHATVLVERPYRMDEIDPVLLREEIASLQANAEPTPSQQDEIDYLELLGRVKESHA
jgi:F-type H+-transporting ATPase subunit epsilon